MSVNQEVQAILTAALTSLGTSTTKTQLNAGANVTIPAWAREIVAFVPYQSLVTPTAAEALHSKLIVESNDVAIVPFEAPLTPVQGMLGAVPCLGSPPLDKFTVHAPVQGGEEIAIYGQALVANTAAPYMGCSVVVSNRRHRLTDGSIERQVFGKCGTLTATGTTAVGEVAGTAYSIHGSEKVIEVIGNQTKTTIAASKPLIGKIRLESSDFKVAVPLTFGIVPVAPVLGTTSGNPVICGQARYKVAVPTNTTCTVQDYHNMEFVTTTAGYWLSAVRFNKVGR